MQDFISEKEACSLSGVSAATLGRFAEAGYLRIETDGDGLKLFSKNELQSVFGLQDYILQKKTAKTPEPGGYFKENSNRGEDAKPAHEARMPAEARREKEVVAREAGCIQSPTPSSFYSAPGFSGFVKPPAMHEELPSAAEASSPADESQLEINRLRKTVEMYEKLISIREHQILDLEEQRTWLRSRVERLEEKGDRDQLLLLSETQTVRQMLMIQAERKSTLRLALEWLGLTGTPPAAGRTIEIEHRTRELSPDTVGLDKAA